MPGFTARNCRVAKHEPDVFAATACVLMPKDYLRFRLTGAKVSDPSDAAGTLARRRAPRLVRCAARRVRDDA